MKSRASAGPISSHRWAYGFTLAVVWLIPASSLTAMETQAFVAQVELSDEDPNDTGVAEKEVGGNQKPDRRQPGQALEAAERGPAASKLPEQRAADDDQRALEFVKVHQAELFQLLTYLRSKNPQQYQEAMRDTGRAALRLIQLKERDEELYAIELNLWQTRCKLRLLAAEISVANDSGKKDRAQEQLKQLVELELEQEQSRTKVQRQRIARQLERLDAQILSHEQDKETRVARALKQWQNRINKQRSSTDKSAPPAKAAAREVGANDG